MTNIFELEEKLKSLLLRDVKFSINGKTIKEGKVKVFNTKQFFINFSLDDGNDSREFKVLYPYNHTELENGFLFDYCLSAFCPRTEDVYWKMKMTDSSSSSKYHESYLLLTFDEPSVG